MSEKKILDEAYDWEPESGVYFGATALEAEQSLREKYPISWPRLLELKIREMQRLLGEVEALSIEEEPADGYQIQRKVNAMRKLAIEVDGGLLEFSQELLTQKSMPDGGDKQHP